MKMEITMQMPAPPGARSRELPAAELPRVSRPLLRWFCGYARRYVRRHFHAVRLARTDDSPLVAARNVVVYLNHASWFDPLICLLAQEAVLPAHRVYAPMDEAALGKYRLFARLGMFPVANGTARGARQFLRQSRAVLAAPQTTLWVTPQGRFADVRERPMQFQPGLAHLAATVSGVVFVPLALEYVFGPERLPEVWLRLGEPWTAAPATAGDTAMINRLLECRLEVTQDALALQVQQRQMEKFECLLQGRRGVGGAYDLWRRFRAWQRGETFHPEHDVR